MSEIKNNFEERETKDSSLLFIIISYIFSFGFYILVYSFKENYFEFTDLGYAQILVLPILAVVSLSFIVAAIIFAILSLYANRKYKYLAFINIIINIYLLLYYIR